MGIPRFFRRHAEIAAEPAGASAVRLWGPGIELVGEVEAFMTGQLADHYALAGQPVPAWMLLNRLAHGSVEEIAALLVAGSGWRLHPSARAWAAAERSLAQRLLAVGRTAYGLDRIQQSVLVPVELSLAGRSRTESFMPGQVLGAASLALDAYSQ